MDTHLIDLTFPNNQNHSDNTIIKNRAILIQLEGDRIAADLLAHLNVNLNSHSLECHVINYTFNPLDAFSQNQLLCVCVGMPIDANFIFEEDNDLPMIDSTKSPNILGVIINAESLLQSNVSLFSRLANTFFSKNDINASTVAKLNALTNWLWKIIGCERLQLFVVGHETLSSADQEKVVSEIKKLYHSKADLFYIDVDSKKMLTDKTKEAIQRFFANHEVYQHPSFMEAYLKMQKTPKMN